MLNSLLKALFHSKEMFCYFLDFLEHLNPVPRHDYQIYLDESVVRREVMH